MTWSTLFSRFSSSLRSESDGEDGKECEGEAVCASAEALNFLAAFELNRRDRSFSNVRGKKEVILSNPRERSSDGEVVTDDVVEDLDVDNAAVGLVPCAAETFTCFGMGGRARARV